jgi:putative SbcD/Mre11-related phosphoesterase
VPARLTVAPGIVISGQGGALLANERIFVIADVHVGYARAARRRGGYLPAVESARAAAARAIDAARELGAEHLVIAGDLRHSTRDADAGEHSEVSAFLERAAEALRVTLVPGNHDRGAASLYDHPVAVSPEPLLLGDVAVAHAPPTEPPERWTICGHLHPAVTVRDETGAGARFPCALVGERVVVLPAFGAWAGGLTGSRLRRTLFPGDWAAYPVAGGEVFPGPRLSGGRGKP